MKIAFLSFTGDGAKLCRKIKDDLTGIGYDCSAFGKAGFAENAGIEPLVGSLSEWTEWAFPAHDALVFIGACGIAVRAIAPHVRVKTSDPAVVVVDEKGKFAISLLSGHLGGANDLTYEIAELIGAEPVITTATDLNGKFAVDDWAKKNFLHIGDLKLAKEVSAAILAGETIGVISDVPISGILPESLKIISEGSGSEPMLRIGIRVSIYETSGPFERTLHLIPKTVAVGIGCRKDAAPGAVQALFEKVLCEHKLSAQCVEKLCSIDIKREEPALRQLAEKKGIPIEFYSAEELEEVDGAFTASAFVNQVTGVDNVCERAAVLGSGGELILKKQSLNGVTAAVAVRTGGYKWTQV